jgi:glycosyltransferase involved in cell wall biosynthesis
MRILLLACSYPPDPVVGSFRAAKLARAFRDAGHDVDVITTRLPGEGAELRVDEPQLRVHTVREVPGPAEFYRHVKARFQGRRRTASLAWIKQPSPATPAAPRRPHVPRWKRYLFSALWVPDNRKGFVPTALVRSRAVLRDGVDLVYTTAPPFSVHLAGLILRLTRRVRWVAEFRDPWIENRSRLHLRSRGADALNRWLERLCVRHADQLVAVSEGTRDLLASKVPTHRQPDVLLALNGIDNLLSRHELQHGSRGPFRVSHIGSCYGGRDPRPFLHALSRIVERRRLTREDVHVEFIGHCRNYVEESLEQLVDKLGLASIVEFHDWVPQEEARARAQSADLFLLPFPEHQRLIPNKLFDYLGFRKPILALVHPDGETTRLLHRVGGHYVVTDNSIDSTEAALEEALLHRGMRKGSAEEDMVLLELTTEHQLQSLLVALGLAADPLDATDLATTARRTS